MNGKTKYSVDGTELTDRYYCFLYNKKDKRNKTHLFMIITLLNDC